MIIAAFGFVHAPEAKEWKPAVVLKAFCANTESEYGRSTGKWYDAKKAHPKASILKGGRVVFNIKANDYRLVWAACSHAYVAVFRSQGR